MKRGSDILFLVCIMLIYLIMFGCTKERIVNPEEKSNNNTVPVQIDFIDGLQDHHTVLCFNDKIYFSALLSGTIPLEGSIAYFTTELPRNENSIFLFCRNLTPPIFKTYQDSTIINFGDADKYYLGIKLIDGNFSYELKDQPFAY